MIFFYYYFLSNLNVFLKNKVMHLQTGEIIWMTVIYEYVIDLYRIIVEIKIVAFLSL